MCSAFTLKTEILFSSFNVRGLKDSIKRKAVFLFCKSQKSNCIFLQETHSESTDVKFWTQQWGDKIIFSHGTNRCAGVAICFNRCPGKVITQEADIDGHWAACVLDIESNLIITINIYGHNNDQKNKQLLHHITTVIRKLQLNYPTEHIIVGGDFNIAPDEWMDRCPSKYSKVTWNPIMEDFMKVNKLNDVWRNLNHNIRQYTWFKPNGQSRSRIDYWLAADSIFEHITEANIACSPLSDHCIINLKISKNDTINKFKGYWKFNSNLLKNNKYCKSVEKIIQDIKNDANLVTAIQKWEYFKFTVRKFSISYSKKLQKERQIEETKLTTELISYYHKSEWSEDDKTNIIFLQSKLDEHYQNKARGAYIRSRARWLEEGEKNTSYFFRLEKQRQEKNTINSLIINDVECTDLKQISQNVKQFYSNLFTSSFSKQDSEFLFRKLKNNIPTIDETFKNICDEVLQIEEFDCAIKTMASDKAPGTDGITANFYKFFWKDIKMLLFDAVIESIKQKELMITMKQGVITLIPKPGKDKRNLNNLRPITLLNTDYKIFTKVLAARLKEGLCNIISSTQSGFLKGRSIHNNIRLVLDLIDYAHLINDDSFILFLDFQKAFDSVEHAFIFETFKQFGFGENFLDIIKMLYKDINSCVSLSEGTCPRFTIKRGIRQGCSLSPLLFITVTELLAILIRNSNLQGLKIMDQNIIISQLADDTTLFLKNKDQIPLAIQTVETFSKASGLKLNLEKCELMSIHNCSQSSIYNIKVKMEVRYLGLWITKTESNCVKLNIENNINKCKQILNNWLQRDLTLFGRTLLTKMETLSRFIYPAYSLSIPPKIIKEINKLNFNFIWRNKHHYIKKGNTIKNFEDGGIKAIDFEIMNGVLKIKWLQSFMKSSHEIWFAVPSMVFSKVGGVEFLLRCDFDIPKLPIKLSAFHQQVLLNWKLAYKHNFSPHNVPIWNNRVVLGGGKSIFMEDWMEKQIWSITHLMDDQGNLYAFEDFRNKYNIIGTKKDYDKIIKKIPDAFIQLIKNNYETKPEVRLPSININGLDLLHKKCNNTFLRQHLTKTMYPGLVRRKFMEVYEKKNQIKLISNFMRFPLPPKYKEIHFKTLHDIYPSNEFIQHRFKIECNNCHICNQPETTEHLFFLCQPINDLWISLYNLLITKSMDVDSFSSQDILYGYVARNNNLEYLMNNIILMLKFYIHKCRYGKFKPSWSVFLNEIHLLKLSLDKAEKPHAKKLLYHLSQIT